MQTNKFPLVDADGAVTEQERLWRATMTEEHTKIRNEAQLVVEKAQLYVPTDRSGVKSVTGDPIDEVSLLSLIAGQFFQSIPVYVDE